MKRSKKNDSNTFILCRKCNSIPLIELVPKENDLKILLSCNCNKQHLIKKQSFYKYYYNDKCMDIEENNNITINKYKEIIEKYKKYKDCFMNKLKELKNKIYNYLEDAIRNIETAIDLNKKYNEDIDKIVEILIKNYQLDPNNNINEKNIINNIQINPFNSFKQFDFGLFTKNIQNLNKMFQSYIKDNYIITYNKYQIIQSIQKSDLIIELNNNIFARFKKNDSIKLFDINDLSKSIIINKNINLSDILTDEKKKYLISVEDDYFINFRKIDEIENKLQNKNKNEDKIVPILVFKHDNPIKNLINLENNLLGLSDDKSIIIYKYNIENKSIELISKLDIRIDKLKLIKSSNKNYISFYNNSSSYLNIYEIPTLMLFKSIHIYKQYNSKIIYEQINENQLIIGQNRCLSIINIKNDNNSNYSIKINFDVMSIKVLKDRTILIGGRSEMKRLFMKTLEELPCFISFDDDVDYDEYDYGFSMPIVRNDSDVLAINELSDGKIMLTLPYDFKIYGIK